MSSLKHLAVNGIRLYFHRLYFQPIFSYNYKQDSAPICMNCKVMVSDLTDFNGTSSHFR